jgi:hypothetical protein
MGLYSSAPMKIFFPVRFGTFSGIKGTIARNRTAENVTPGRSNSMLDAIFAPFE